MTIATTLSLGGVEPGTAVIRSERLTLRPLRRSDVGLIEHYASDRRLAEGTRSMPHPLPPGAIEAWIGRAAARNAGSNRILPGATETGQPDLGRTRIWAIDGSEANLAEVLGVISLHPVAEAQCEVEFWIGAGLWNTGFATEALAALIAANPGNCSSLVAEAFQDNPSSARVLINCGFSYLGDAESWSVARDARVATWTYALSLV